MSKITYFKDELKKELNIYNKNNYEKKLIVLNQKLDNLIFKKEETEIYFKQIDLLKMQKNKKNNQYFSGTILYLEEDIFNQNKTANSIAFH